MLKPILFLSLLTASSNNWAQFKINDTLFFVRTKTDSFYHRIFVDDHKNSKFYSSVSDFTIKGFEKDTYERSLEYLYSRKLFPKKKTLNEIPREWVMLETYKNKVYVNSPCDYYFHYRAKFTDSIFINWDGEGPEATYIERVIKEDQLTYHFFLKSQTYKSWELTIKYLDIEKGIAVFRKKFFNDIFNKADVRYQLMVEVKKMREIPLLVNYCDYQKESELEFDKIDYSAKFKHIR